MPVFGSERIVYWREASALPQPLHTLAYFVGKDIAWLPQVLVGPALFTIAYTSLTFPRDTFFDIYCEAFPPRVVVFSPCPHAHPSKRSYFSGRVLVRIRVWLPRRSALAAVSCSAARRHAHLCESEMFCCIECPLVSLPTPHLQANSMFAGALKRGARSALGRHAAP